MATAELRIEEKLNEEISSFLSQSGIQKFQFDDENKVTFSDFLSNKMLIISAIRTGIPYSLFDLIQHLTPFTDSDWADFLDISTKSLQRYKISGEHYFKSIHSEKIIEMAEVTQIGMEVFGDVDKLKLWLNTPNFALGKLKPVELLKDSYGKEMVITELTRINYGIFV